MESSSQHPSNAFVIVRTVRLPSYVHGSLQKPRAARKVPAAACQRLLRHDVRVLHRYRMLDRPGFGEVFFNANGIDAIDIILRNND
jgi:hypothetical protein